MAFDSRSGFCISSGPPGPAAPFAPQLCFQTAYVPNQGVSNNAFAWDSLGCGGKGILGDGSLSCEANGNTLGACTFNEECGPTGICDAGRCWSRRNTGGPGQVHSPWTYDAGNPKVVTSLPWEEVQRMARAMGMEKAFQEFAQQYAFGSSMFLVQHKGQTHVATPLNVQYFRQDPQCSTCLKSVWQCDRYADAAKYDAEAKQLHEQCLELRDSFLYDVLLPGGVLVPIMVKMNPVALKAATAALQKCVQHCGDCMPNTPLARGEQGLFY